MNGGDLFNQPEVGVFGPPEEPQRFQKKELRRLPKTVLLKIAVELDPDTVAESYDEGWTKDDILRVIERHIKEAIGRQPIEGWPYVHEVTIFGSEIELEGEEPPVTPEIEHPEVEED